MAINVIAGSKLWIGGSKTDKPVVDASDFTGEAWVEIAPLTNLGGVMASYGIASQEIISESTTRYRKTVKSVQEMSNSVLPDKSDPGQVAYDAAVDDCHPHAFMIQWSADCGTSSTVTMTIAAPGVITWTGHGLAAGTPVSFTTTGALPTGIVEGTTYYVAAAPAPTTNDFSVAATPGGTAITTSGTQSGTHTATSQPVGGTEMFFGLATGGGRSGGAASDVATKAINIQPTTNVLTI